MFLLHQLAQQISINIPFAESLNAFRVDANSKKNVFADANYNLLWQKTNLKALNYVHQYYIFICFPD